MRAGATAVWGRPVREGKEKLYERELDESELFEKLVKTVDEILPSEVKQELYFRWIRWFGSIQRHFTILQRIPMVTPVSHKWI
ncbi:MAG: hypothetical protein HA489_04175 [Archaeoglobales archaeon]|nr:hypothetical protein [Archaeoglobales archaeon]